MGLVSGVVPHEELDTEISRWCTEIMERSPTAIAIAKRSFNADTENIRGISAMGLQALNLYYQSEESKEGVRAHYSSPISAFAPGLVGVFIGVGLWALYLGLCPCTVQIDFWITLSEGRHNGENKPAHH